MEVLESASRLPAWSGSSGWMRCWRPLTAALAGLGRGQVERALGVTMARRLYEASRLREEPLFCDRALAALDVTYTATGNATRLPAAGPLIVVANHPLGALDGLVLMSLVSRYRRDVRCLASRVLEVIPDARADMLFVDATGGSAAAAFNRRPLRHAVQWVRSGGCLCVFPSGVVSHITARDWTVRDGPWHASTARLVRATGAPVVPCFIDGANSRAFQIAGLVDPRLRTLLLVRELLRRRGTTVGVRVGEPAGPNELPEDPDCLARELRARVYALGGKAAAGGEVNEGGLAARWRPGIPATASDEVASVRAEQWLAQSDDYGVFWTTALQAPRLVHEIGLAREETFRAVGEGTGKAVDLDAFDNEYVHLCVWNRAAGELAGAYRLNRLDLRTAPHASLYTRTLFRFHPGLEQSLHPALELGRAFVRPPYQKQFAPLMLLWTGIGRFVATRSRSRFLFGAVSISSAYSVEARRLIVAFLRRHAWDAARARLVEAHHPLTFDVDGARLESSHVPDDVATLDDAVRAADGEGKGLPVLLRQYLKLHASALGFGIDPAFGNTIDVLMAVDLPAAPASMLRRYMGAEQARAYLAAFADGELRRAG